MPRTGAFWKDLPQWYPPYQTCPRWFYTWVRQGVFKQILTGLGEDLYQCGGIDIRETFIDGSFTPAKKGGMGTLKRLKKNGQSSLADARCRRLTTTSGDE
jgi:hypothetical protein